MAAGKKWVVTPAILNKIGELASRGVTEASIARIIGLSPTTFSAKKKEFPEMEEAIRQAHANGETEAVNYLWEIIHNPSHKSHFAALCFYLKCKHNWGDTQETNDKPSLPSGVDFRPASK